MQVFRESGNEVKTIVTLLSCVVNNFLFATGTSTNTKTTFVYTYTCK